MPIAWLGALAALLFGATGASAAPEQWRVAARAIYADVIAMPTVAGRDRVSAMAAYLAERFRNGGFAAGDIHVLPYEKTAALVVRYRGDNASGRKPILLLAHMDVVDAKAADWSTDPFTLVEKDGYFYGRGTLDVKSGVVQLAVTFLRLKAEGFVPDRDLIIAFTGDEETTTGTARALATRWRDLIDCEYALNADGGGGWFDAAGKPLGYRIDASEKTSVIYALTATNKGGHAALPRPDNAIYDLAGALTRLAALRFPPQADAVTRGYFAAVAPYRDDAMADAMRRFAADPTDARAAESLAADPIENAMTRTTCVATELAGGIAPNALPQTATATVNCRLFPGTPVARVTEALRQVAGPRVTVSVVGDVRQSAPSPLRADVLAAFAAAVHARFPAMAVIPSMSIGYSDGRELRAAGIPTYSTGGNWLRMPADARAHGKDERLAVDAFYGGLNHWYALTKALTGGRRSPR